MVTTSRPLRADAERNRQTLIDSAVEVFGRRGLDAPLDEIAQAAGVGNATLYRHFPSRCDLVAAAFTEQMTLFAKAVERALADPDPWRGLCDYLRTICDLQLANRGLGDLLTTTNLVDRRIDRMRSGTYRQLSELISRAQRSGDLRADFTPEDVLLILMANVGVIRRTAELAPGAAARLLALLIDGLRASAATPTVASPSARSMVRVMAAG